jgi:hypothetical protein
MPLVRVELPAGTPAEYRTAVGEAIQQAMHAALKVPLGERFHIFTEHAPGDLLIDRIYLGIERSADAIVVQVTLNEGRDAEVKRGFYKTLADRLHERIGLRPEDLVVNLVEENAKTGRSAAVRRSSPDVNNFAPRHSSKERCDDTMCADLDGKGW